MTVHDMTGIVEAPPDGEVRDRLYPRAYLDPTEETAQGEYDALVHDDLVRSRQEAFALIEAGLASAEPNRKGLIEITLGPDQEMQWLTALNDARLVIGTALGVTEETDTDYARVTTRVSSTACSTAGSPRCTSSSSPSARRDRRRRLRRSRVLES